MKSNSSSPCRNRFITSEACNLATGIQPKLLTMLVVRLTSYACLPNIVNLTTNFVSSLGKVVYLVLKGWSFVWKFPLERKNLVCTWYKSWTKLY